MRLDRRFVGVALIGWRHILLPRWRDSCSIRLDRRQSPFCGAALLSEERIKAALQASEPPKK
jgi:hypothetical protein